MQTRSAPSCGAWGTFDMSNIKSQNWRLSYLCHPFFSDYQIMSEHFSLIMPVIKQLEVKALIRIKINLYPSQETLTEHGKHQDFPFPHKAAIFSLNTCDGYTKLNDGTKIESVENRLLLFPNDTLHTSVRQTDTKVRVVINFDFFHNY